MTSHGFLHRLRQDSAWIPWAFVAGFGVIFAANGAMIYAALHSWTGIEVDHYYQRGLHFNEDLQRVRRQAALGWHGTVREIRDPAGLPLIELTLLDSSGRPLTGADVRAEMVRPTVEGYDFTLDLKERGGGVYAARLTAPLPGQWEARVNAQRGRDRFRVDERVMVRE